MKNSKIRKLRPLSISLLTLISFSFGHSISSNKAHATNWARYNTVIERCYKNRLNDNFDKAIDFCSKAIKIYPRSGDGFFNRGFAHDALGNTNEAISDYERSLELDTKKASQWTYNNLSLLYAEQEKYEKAIEYINVAIKLNSKDGQFLNNRGWIYLQSENFKQAEKDYQNAEILYLKNKRTRTYADCPKTKKLVHCMLDSQFYNDLGWAQENLSDYRAALKNYDKAISINFPEVEDDYVYYSNRANVKLELDDKEGACRDYKTSALMGNQDTYDWLNSWNGRWCRKMKT